MFVKIEWMHPAVVHLIKYNASNTPPSGTPYTGRFIQKFEKQQFERSEHDRTVYNRIGERSHSHRLFP